MGPSDLYRTSCASCSCASDCDDREQAGATLLVLHARKTARCRYHHVLTLLAMGKLEAGRAQQFHLGPRGGAPPAPELASHRYLRGVHLSADRLRLVPNFSVTPRLMHSPSFVTMLLDDDDLAVVPAVNGRLVRLFRDEGGWTVATNRSVCRSQSRVGSRFRQALALCTQGPLEDVAARLGHACVYFFLLPRDYYDAGAAQLYYAGRKPLLRVRAAEGDVEDAGPFVPAHEDCPRALAGVPPVPAFSRHVWDDGYSATYVGVSAWQGHRVCPEAFRYASQFNGVLAFHRETLSAVRIVDPLVAVLGPDLEGRAGPLGPDTTIARVLHQQRVVGTASMPHRMLYAVALHTALVLLSTYFPAEYMRAIGGPAPAAQFQPPPPCAPFCCATVFFCAAAKRTQKDGEMDSSSGDSYAHSVGHRESYWVGILTVGFVLWVAAVVFAAVWTMRGGGGGATQAFTVRPAPAAPLSPGDVYGQVQARVKMPSVQDGTSGHHFQSWVSGGVGPSERELSAPGPSASRDEEEGRALFAAADRAQVDESQYSMPDVNIHGKDVRALMEAIVDRPDAERGRLGALERSRDILRGNFGPCRRTLDFFYRGPYAKFMKGLEFYPVANYDYEDGKADIVFGTEPNEASMG